MLDATQRLRTRQKPTFLGIDLGTSSVKAVLTDERGTVVSRASCSYPIETPRQTWSETDPERWWAGVATAVRTVTAGSSGPVRGIGLSGQMHGVVVDETGRALRPAITWADSRAVDQLSRYRDLPAQVRTRLANPWTPGMAGPLLAWLKDNEPATYRKTRWALQPKDWVRGRLTGLMAAEPSDASATPLYDVISDGWDVEAVVALGLDPALLPPLLKHSGAPAGALLDAAAQGLGLTSETPVAAGAADSAAAVFASGPARGQAQITSGRGLRSSCRLPRLTHLPPSRSSHTCTGMPPPTAGTRWRRFKVGGWCSPGWPKCSVRRGQSCTTRPGYQRGRTTRSSYRT